MKISDEVKKYSIAHPVFKIHGDLVLNGCFQYPYRSDKIMIVASAGDGWEHVSVSLLNRNRCPNWQEMCVVKDLFWTEDDTVIQFHPKKAEHINFHPYTLHLWKKIGTEHELPPSYMIGPKE